METTDMAVVVSPGPERDRRSRRPRARHPAAPRADEPRGPGREVQGSADDPLRLVFVCAMWMTGFDAPSVLDDLPRQADAQPHADADDRPRQPRLPRQGQRPDRRLRRRLPEPGEGAGDLRRRERREASTRRSRTSTRWSGRWRPQSTTCVELCCAATASTLIAMRDANGFDAHRPARRRGRGAAGGRGDPHRRSWRRRARCASCSRRCFPTRGRRAAAHRRRDPGAGRAHR